MCSFLVLLMVIQLVGVFIAGIAAVVDIRSILVSGPILSGIGLLITALNYFECREVGFWFGLSVPSMSVLCLSIIFGFDLGHRAATVPIVTLIVIFTTACVPLGVLAIREPPSWYRPNGKSKFQFPIETLFKLMFLIAIPLALIQLGGKFGPAIGFIALYTIMVACLVRRFYRRREESEVRFWQDHSAM